MATYKQIPQYFGNDTIPYAYKCSKHGIYSDGFYCSGCEEEWQVEERIRKSQEQARQREQHEQEAVLKKRQEAEAAERNRRLEAEVAAHKRKLDAEVAETKKRLEIEKASVASGATPESLTARAQYFLEYYEWENADRALETVLNIDPHYAPAFIGKLCIYLKINKKENLVHHHVPLEDIRYFKDAMRFADEELRNELAGINQTIKDRVRKAEEEARKRKVAEERKHKIAEEEHRKKQGGIIMELLFKVEEERKHKIAEEEHRKKQERIKLMELLLRLKEMKDMRYFKDAMRFADEELRNELVGVNQTIKDWVRKVEEEDRKRKAEEEARKRKVAEERKHKIAEEEHRKKQGGIIMELLFKVAEERKHKIAEEEHRKKQERIKLMELLLRLEEMKMDDALFLLLLWLKSEYGYEW